MFTARIPLFRVRGIPINADVSWLIILALLTMSLAGFYTETLPDLTPTGVWLLGLGTALAFFACIVLHELGHALTAQRLGIPLRGITLFLFGGVAEMEGEPKSARDEFLMAAAGPAVSAVLAGVFWGLLVLGAGAGWPQEALLVLSSLAVINIAVLVFNLVPAFPLDGGRVLRSALWAATGNLRRATWWASLAGQGFAWLLIFGGILLFFRGAWLQGMWLVLIGMFLNNAAVASYQQVVVRQALHGEPLRRFMNTSPVVVAPDLDLRQFVEDYVYRYHHKTYPVVADGRVEGVISTRMLANHPRGEWGRHTVGEAMERDIKPVSIGPDADALQALDRMQRTGSARLLVMEGERLSGIVSLKDLLSLLQLKLELEGEGDEQGPPPYRHDGQRQEGQTPAQV
jgi:Zn-dependent protease/CBS domain-containing protein